MAKAQNKTKPTVTDPETFLAAVENEKRRDDCRVVLKMMAEITGEEPVLWGSSLVGFGKYHYKYESGREGDFFLTGASPRKTALTVYIMPGFSEYEDLMNNLGKYKTGKSCLYIKKLEDVDQEVLKELITLSVQQMREKYPD